MRRNLDCDECVAPSAGAFLTLPRKTDLRAVFQPRWKLEVDGLAVAQRYALGLQRHGIGERDLQPVRDVRAFLRRARPLAEPAEAASALLAATGGGAEQAFEQVAKVRRIAAEVELVETRRRTTGLRAGSAPRVAAEAAAERHLRIAFLVDLAAVVLRAFVLVRQQVVRMRDLREA